MNKKQNKIYEFIYSYTHKNSYVPTNKEIADHIGFKSAGSVSKYIKSLVALGGLKRKIHGRGYILSKMPERSIQLPMLGNVAAGIPIESISENESITVSKSMLKGDDNFALTITGDSMVDEGIMDGDTVLVKKQSYADNGKIVVALIDNEATVKKFYRKKDCVELHPANSEMEPIIVEEGEVEIAGTVVGLLRKYR